MLTLAALAFNRLVKKDDLKVRLSMLLQGTINFLYEILDKDCELDINYYMFEEIFTYKDNYVITLQDVKSDYHILKYKIIKYINKELTCKRNELGIMVRSISRQLNINKSIVDNCISCQSISNDMNNMLMIREIIRRTHESMF